MSILQKEPTFFILHNHFYKIHTSDYLLDTLFHLNNYFIYLFIYYYYYYYFHLMILSRFSSDLKGFFSLRHCCCFFFVDFSSSSSFLLLLLITWKCPRKKKRTKKETKMHSLLQSFWPKISPPQIQIFSISLWNEECPIHGHDLFENYQGPKTRHVN